MQNKKRFFLIFILGLIFNTVLASCSQKQTTLNVYAGDALQIPLEKIKNLYEEENPNITVNYYYAGSKTAEETIRTLEQGDVIVLSEGIIEHLSEDNLLLSDYPVGEQTASLIVRKNDTTVQSWEDLSKEGVRIALINPQMGVVGSLSQKIIGQSPQAEKIQANITRLTADPSESLTLVENDKVDAAIIFPSIARNNENISILEIPKEINQGISVWVGVPVFTTTKKEALAFAEFVASETGLEIFYNVGFSPIQ